MIICASRRTDIPAFHSEWMMNRLRAGYALVRNPVSRTTVHRVDLTRRNVDCIMFITKDPRPMVPHMKEIGFMGHMTLFHVTLTPYGKDLEPGVPFKADINDACEEIAGRIGRDRMVWRYDPVILNSGISLEYHRRKFTMMCREASRWTDRCVFSFVDIYGKLLRLEESGAIRRISPSEMDAFAKMASEVARDNGITLSCCCGERDLTRFGIERRACMDAATMRSLDIPYETQSVPLRRGCTCVRSIDIGEYDTCGHGCVYCYAGHRDADPSRRRLYSDDTELLWGALMPRDRVVDMKGRDAGRLDDYRVANFCHPADVPTGHGRRDTDQ